MDELLIGYVTRESLDKVGLNFVSGFVNDVVTVKFSFKKEDWEDPLIPIITVTYIPWIRWEPKIHKRAIILVDRKIRLLFPYKGKENDTGNKNNY